MFIINKKRPIVLLERFEFYPSTLGPHKRRKETNDHKTYVGPQETRVLLSITSSRQRKIIGNKQNQKSLSGSGQSYPKPPDTYNSGDEAEGFGSTCVGPLETPVLPSVSNSKQRKAIGKRQSQKSRNGGGQSYPMPPDTYNRGDDIQNLDDTCVRPQETPVLPELPPPLGGKSKGKNLLTSQHIHNTRCRYNMMQYCKDVRVEFTGSAIIRLPKGTPDAAGNPKLTNKKRYQKGRHPSAPINLGKDLTKPDRLRMKYYIINVVNALRKYNDDKAQTITISF